MTQFSNFLSLPFLPLSVSLSLPPLSLQTSVHLFLLFRNPASWISVSPPMIMTAPPLHSCHLVSPLDVKFILLSLLLFFSDTILSESVIENLPGFRGKLPFRLETGYIGVGEGEQVELFYYFIESEESPEYAPLILWLTGGPSCSGLSGLLYEIGPLTFDYANSVGSIPTLVLNRYSWTKVANIIFIDQPVGTGFSYAKTPGGYKSSDKLAGAYTYEFLKKKELNGFCSGL